jgi:acyl carrier protein
MADVDARLARCFCAVFPKLTAETAAKARIEGVEGWDSMATITLVNVVEEEFGLEIDPNDLAKMVSFESVLAYIKGRGAA